MQKIAVRYLRARFRLFSFISPMMAAKKALDLFRTPVKRQKKQLPVIFHHAEQLQFGLENILIRGYRWNHPADKKILIVHGFQSSVFNFSHFIHPLVAKHYEVLAFDAPAHGNSGGKTITAPLFAKMIRTIHEQFGPVQSYLAHSFGGLAVSLAMEDIHHDESYKIVFIAPATETKTAIDQFFHHLRLNARVRAEFDKLIAEIGGHPAEWYSIYRAAMNIHAHILWIHDEDDVQTPIADALKLKNENPDNITFVITNGLGHRRIYRDAEAVKKVLEFL